MLEQDIETSGEVETELSLLEALKETVLSGLSMQLTSFRNDAVSARIESGIEEIWRYVDQTMESRDFAGVGAKNKVSKDSLLRGLSPKQDKAPAWKRSTAFFNITSPYVVLAAKRVHEILFPTDMRSWELRRTPRTDLDELALWLKEVASPEELPTIAGIIQGLSLEREEQIAIVQDQIDDWLKESPMPFVDVAEEVIYDAAALGVGVVKGPVPVISEGGRMQPGIFRVSPWDLFPSRNCGNNIHNGDYIFEREPISERLLRENLEKADLGWLPDQLLLALESGPRSFAPSEYVQGNIFELWHFQGEVPLKALQLCGCAALEDGEGKAWANVTLCNDRVVRIGRAPLQERFTYQALPWRKRPAFWAGVGIAEDNADVQSAVNAQLRNLLDNSALSAVPQLVTWDGVIAPVDGSFEIAPGKEWRVTVDATDPLAAKVKDAIFTIEIPCRLNELRDNTNFLLSLSEQITGISGVVMGLQQPLSVGGGQIQMNASGFYSRRVARHWDAYILRPLIQAFVQWVKDLTDLALAEVNVAVYGSTTLVERDLQAQAAMQAVQLAANPIYGHDPEKMMDQWLLSNKFDPAKSRMSPERKAELQALIKATMEQEPMPAPQVQSAQIRAQALSNQAAMEAQSDQLRTMGQLEDAARNRQHQKEMQILGAKIDLMNYAAKKGIDLKTAEGEFARLRVPEKLIDSDLASQEKENEIASKE